MKQTRSFVLSELGNTKNMMDLSISWVVRKFYIVDRGNKTLVDMWTQIAEVAIYT